MLSDTAQATGSAVCLSISLVSFNMNDGFVKSPTSALRCIPALLNSRYARRRSRFNRVNHCDVLYKVRLIPQDGAWRLEEMAPGGLKRDARLEFGAFCFAA
jgi:hypothetical protein